MSPSLSPDLLPDHSRHTPAPAPGPLLMLFLASFALHPSSLPPLLSRASLTILSPGVRGGEVVICWSVAQLPPALCRSANYHVMCPDPSMGSRRPGSFLPPVVSSKLGNRSWHPVGTNNQESQCSSMFSYTKTWGATLESSTISVGKRTENH